MKKIFLGMTFASLTALSATSFGGAYIGLNVGDADPDISGFDNDTSWTVLAGYNYNEYIGVEANYTKLGDFDFDLGGSVEVDGWGVSLVGKYPVAEQFDLYAKLGGFSWDAKAKAYGYSESDDGTDFTWTVGASYSLDDNIDINAQYSNFDIDGDDVRNITIGINYNF